MGSGIPTVGNVHEVALARDPTARVAYVDDDPVAAAHSAAILADVDEATITRADLRDPAAVLAAATVAGHLDFSRPVALLAMAVLHFVPDEDEPWAILRRYREALAPGSVLAMTHTSHDYPEHPDFEEHRREILRLYSSTSNPLHQRTRSEIRAMVASAGFQVDAGDLREVDSWADPQHDGQPLGMFCLITDPLPSTG